MAFAPQQNWTVYQNLTKGSDWQNARALSAQQRFVLYEDLFRIVCCRRQSPAQLSRSDQRRWANKLETRLRLNAAYQIMDELRRG